MVLKHHAETKMGIRITKEQASVICRMDEQLKIMFADKPEKQWEHQFCRQQIIQRKEGKVFLLEDHMRGMVYSMLSGGRKWDELSKKADSQGLIPEIEEIFYHFKNPQKILETSNEQLYGEMRKHSLTSRSSQAQITALKKNIVMLQEWEYTYDSVDNYYQQYIDNDNKRKGLAAPGISLIKTLSQQDSPNKLKQMDVALVCEYLKNVGYEFPKPDTHIRRILGRDILGFSASREATPYQAIEIIFKLAGLTGKSAAETDYILWAYCADGYGEICTSRNPKCTECVAYKQCQKQTGDILNSIKNKCLLEALGHIEDSDSFPQIIKKAAGPAYYSFQRRVFHGNSVSKELNEEIKNLLADKIPELLNSASQKDFDDIHHQICEAILQKYQPVCEQTYGIAQRWLNETLMNLVVIDSAMRNLKIDLMRSRKYFHVPVSETIIKIAASKAKDHYLNGLGLKAVPLEQETAGAYQMDWYVPGKTLRFEKWGYSEYMEFQTAVRNELKSFISKGIYQDVLDWGFHALVETL